MISVSKILVGKRWLWFSWSHLAYAFFVPSQRKVEILESSHLVLFADGLPFPKASRHAIES